MQDKNFTSKMLNYAGVLMSISGILMAIGARIAYGVTMFVSAACMFIAARYFRIAEDKKENENREAGHERNGACCDRFGDRRQ